MVSNASPRSHTFRPRKRYIQSSVRYSFGLDSNASESPQLAAALTRIFVLLHGRWKGRNWFEEYEAHYAQEAVTIGGETVIFRQPPALKFPTDSDKLNTCERHVLRKSDLERLAIYRARSGKANYVLLRAKGKDFTFEHYNEVGHIAELLKAWAGHSARIEEHASLVPVWTQVFLVAFVALNVVIIGLAVWLAG